MFQGKHTLECEKFLKVKMVSQPCACEGGVTTSSGKADCCKAGRTYGCILSQLSSKAETDHEPKI